MNAMTTRNTQTGFSDWERRVFTSLNESDQGKSLPLAELNHLLAEGSEPIDSAFAGIVKEFMSFHYGDSEEADIEVSSNIVTAREGDFEGSHHEILVRVWKLQYTYYWGDTESILDEIVSLCEAVEADASLHGENEFLTFLNNEVLDNISFLYWDYTRAEVEGGYVTHMTIEDIDNMDAAIGRVGELSKA